MFRKPLSQSGTEEAATQLNLLPPSRASLLGLRGLLLHADYTRELADKRLASGLRLTDADRVARDGIENPDLYTKRVDKKVYDQCHLPQVWSFFVSSLIYLCAANNSVCRISVADPFGSV